MKKITLFIFFLLIISGGFAQKNKYLKMVAYPMKDSIITLNSDSDYVKMYMLTPVAEEIVKTFPGMVSITFYNRRLAEMRVDLAEFDSQTIAKRAYSLDLQTKNITRHRFNSNMDNGNYLYYEKSSKDYKTRSILYFQKSDSVWFFADYFNGLCSIMSSSATLNEIMINLKPRKREFTNSSIAPLRFYISTSSRKDKFLKIFVQQLGNSE